jgi:hypothetical protein
VKRFLRVKDVDGKYFNIPLEVLKEEGLIKVGAIDCTVDELHTLFYLVGFYQDDGNEKEIEEYN